MIKNYCSVWHHGTTQSQHPNNDNNYNDDNVMCASVWFEYFGGLLKSKPMIYGKEMWQRRKLKLSTSVWRYKRGSDIYICILFIYLFICHMPILP